MREDLTHAPGPRGPALLVVAAALAPAAALGGNRPVLSMAMAAAALAALVWAGRRAAAPPAAGALLAGVVAWALTQAAFGISADADATWRAAARLAAYGAIFAAAASAPPRLAVGAVAVWAAALSAYGLWAWAAVANPVLGRNEAYGPALEATFVNRNGFALYAGVGALACLTRLWMATGTAESAGANVRRLARGGWVWAAGAAVCVAALAAAGSRGGAAAAALGLFALTALLARDWRAAAAVAALAGAGALALTAARGGPAPLDEARWEIHGALWRAIGDAPLSGRGLGAFADAFRPYAAAEWRWGDWDHAHQMYLETVFELGAPAALALFAAIALVAAGLIRPVLRRRPAAALGLAALAAAAAQGVWDFGLAIPAVAALVALLLGAGWAERRP